MKTDRTLGKSVKIVVGIPVANGSYLWKRKDIIIHMYSDVSLVIRAHELITLIRAHGLLNRAHGLLSRAHGLIIRAHGLVIRAHELA